MKGFAKFSSVVLFIAGVVVGVLTLAFAQTRTKANTQPHATTSAWMVRVTKDRVDDSTKTAFVLPSVDHTAALHLECTSGVTFGDNRKGTERQFYISTNQFLETEQYVQFRVDLQPPFFKNGIISTNYHAMFIEDEGGMVGWYSKHSGMSEEMAVYTEFIPKVLQAKRLLVKLGVFHSTDKTWEFHPSSIDMETVNRVCRISELLPRDAN